ncbi:hypothetical protein NVP1102O_05 [Vibrio phage 1.102.O._10N.261.45.E3]|uniref:Uncharacterized protein n=8 Tax=Autolykiviridae TaxID=2184034 RepID=A0A2I7R1V8_9VIRU|nr:hypothetical protein KMD64_gp04 [Vibrio phage 1.044.O._10N.261.51.B8]AUR83887.1 hypothetical protein NVP1043O_04 [Vibrio phage 1.043.O._10N.261.52.C7]AUR84092.1 hypothetical protein NVP1048O_05 [Vibrio phage 1.048.O._10N.286.46.A10]AUR84499.1 hypothetical protein NVP1057O_04 [Vibrio phage 1.057.O._10N.261.46.B12]AUR87640.1 hypothetical protein NVP1102O_05 [Vibrio phage 1.102.O._10N.261.45.E3]AUR88005.1 hypothetical protein NVP1107A_05 [Vibrio phage 1.107.A._10N.286.52.E10]AUR88027.1 hypoth
MTKQAKTFPTFKRIAAVSLPLLSLDYGKDGAAKSHFIKIEKAFVDHVSAKEDAKPDMMKSTVTELESGEQFDIYLHKGLAAKFEAGKAYEVVTRKVQGKRFPEHTIYEIEVA